MNLNKLNKYVAAGYQMLCSWYMVPWHTIKHKHTRAASRRLAWSFNHGVVVDLKRPSDWKALKNNSKLFVCFVLSEEYWDLIEINKMKHDTPYNEGKLFHWIVK